MPQNDAKRSVREKEQEMKKKLLNLTKALVQASVSGLGREAAPQRVIHNLQRPKVERQDWICP